MHLAGCFLDNKTASYWLTSLIGAAYEGGVVEAADDGVIRFTFLIGSETRSGLWTMSAYGQESDRLGIITLTGR